MATIKFEGIERRDYWQGQEKKRLVTFLKPHIPGGLKPAKEAAKLIVSGSTVSIEITELDTAQLLLPKLQALGLIVTLEK